MKSDLILRKFPTEMIVGTNTAKEVKSFFGSKMLEIEDFIEVENDSIQYSEVSDSERSDNGFQFYVFNSDETIFVRNLSDLKKDNHSIELDHQTESDLLHNTKWTIEIDAKNILRYYLFYRIKESRAFKCVSPDDLVNKDINLSILDYINENTMNRYRFTRIDFYAKYSEITQEQSIYLTDPLLRYDPKFKVDVTSTGELVKNFNVKEKDMYLTATYNQTKKSEDYKFDYYFNLYFEKI